MGAKRSITKRMPAPNMIQKPGADTDKVGVADARCDPHRVDGVQNAHVGVEIPKGVVNPQGANSEDRVEGQMNPRQNEHEEVRPGDVASLNLSRESARPE